MNVTQTLSTVRFVTDPHGKRTDVLIPVKTWDQLLITWQQLLNDVEDREDSIILRTWLEKRAAGQVEIVSLETLEEELRADGLLSD